MCIYFFFRLCVTFSMKGGGFLTSKTVNNIETKIPYDKTEATNKTLCYIYDRATPIHCSEKGSCKHEPLKLSTRVTNSRKVHVKIDGWIDPLPPIIANSSFLASGIKSYAIEVYEVIASSPETLMRDQSSKGKENISIESIGSNIEIELPSKNPMLYTMILEVTDSANNVHHARRFVLYDNTSAIEVNDQHHLRVETASNASNYQWQTNHEKLCYSWSQRYFNNYYKKNNPFRAIKSDTYSDVIGLYDQISGILPINGTVNVNGLNGFYYAILKNQIYVTSGRVENFTSEALCTYPTMSDGDEFIFQLQAKDIMNHTLNDSVSVYIDRSVPEISDIWLTRNGYKQLFVHHTIDLSDMAIEFKAFDVHSGVREMKWTFGTYENNTVLIEKAIGVKSVVSKIHISVI